MSGLQPKLIDEPKQVLDRGPPGRRQFRLSITAKVGPDYIKLLREGAGLRLPHPRVSDARVQKDDRKACACALAMEPCAVDGRFQLLGQEVEQDAVELCWSFEAR